MEWGGEGFVIRKRGVWSMDRSSFQGLCLGECKQTDDSVVRSVTELGDLVKPNFLFNLGEASLLTRNILPHRCSIESIFLLEIPIRKQYKKRIG